MGVRLENVILGNVSIVRVSLSPKRRGKRPAVDVGGFLLLEKDGYMLFEDGGKIVINE